MKLNNDYLNESLSQGISSQKIKIKKTGEKLYQTESSGKYLYIIIPSAILLVVIALLIITKSYDQFSFKDYFGLLLFCFIFGAGLKIFRNFIFKPITFDFDQMIFAFKNQQEYDLKQVEAIQILTYHHSVSGNYKIRFEINLCMKEGFRIHLFNNSKYQLVTKQANFLAKELGVVVVDGTNV